MQEFKLTDQQKINFWDKVRPREGEGCWLWIGAISSRGYGNFSIDRRIYSAHRISFYMEYGYLTEVIMHSCDIKNCINPSHLKAGTQLDNIKDMFEKGRNRALEGENHPRRVLNHDEAIQIRALYTSGYYSLRSLAKLFQIGKTTVIHIINNDNWK